MKQNNGKGKSPEHNPMSRARAESSQLLDDEELAGTSPESVRGGIDNLKERGRDAASDLKSKAKNAADKTRRS